MLFKCEANKPLPIIPAAMNLDWIRFSEIAPARRIEELLLPREENLEAHRIQLLLHGLSSTELMKTVESFEAGEFRHVDELPFNTRFDARKQQNSRAEVHGLSDCSRTSGVNSKQSTRTRNSIASTLCA